MAENVIGSDDSSLPPQYRQTEPGTINFNTVTEGGDPYNGMVSADVEAYLVGNVNLVDSSETGEQLADNDPQGNPNGERDPNNPHNQYNSDDMYNLHGSPEVAQSNPQRNPEEVEGTKVTIKEGQTLWGLIGQHYGGKYPLEAVYEANNMQPRVVEQKGKKELVDPIYHVGDTFVLPPESQLEELTARYRERVNGLGKTSEERVGSPTERTEVKLIFGDTLWSLASKKYGTNDPPLAAIYEANNMTPQVIQKDGKTELVAPTYYAGKTYVLPAENEIAQLTEKFWQRMGGHPSTQDSSEGRPDPVDPYDYSQDPPQQHPDPNPNPNPNPEPGPGGPPNRRLRY